jgi:hypothetical protein
MFALFMLASPTQRIPLDDQTSILRAIFLGFKPELSRKAFTS